jgi:murein DD-endopeptidase MepM/ murein hydrolase activator NlpD
MKSIISPTGTVTTQYGVIDATHPHGHRGLDFACKIGEDIHSPVDGIVSRIVHQGSESLGNGVYIKTTSGYKFIFGHLSEIKVKLYEQINSGDVIGLCGSTGRSFGSHLHFASLDPLGHFMNPQEALERIHDIAVTIADLLL